MGARRLRWLLLAVLPGCAIAHSAEEGELLGTFRVTVDASDDAEEASVLVEDVTDARDAAPDPKASAESVLSRVSLVGPGTWNAATKRLGATVRITNVSAPAMDEPFMVVRSVTQPSSCVVFEQTHAGGSHVGAQYRYADVTAPGATAVNGASAKQNLVIRAPCTKNFSFTVDVRAVVRGSRRIVPDRDDDRFNIEPSQAAGDDCNDNDPNAYPGGPVPCTCSTACGSSCAAGCCDETCGANCNRTCVAGCVCDVHPGPAGSGANPSSLTCQAGSNCNLDCAGTTSGCDLTCSNATCTAYCENTAHNRDCTASCSNGSECAQQCVGADRHCYVNSCTGGSDCTLDCADTANDCRYVNGCDNGSTCSLTCDETGGSCSMTTCTGRADCEVSCNGTTRKDCLITTCTNGSTCEVECTGAVGGKCGIASCTGGAHCAVTCDDTRAGSCTLSCAAGTTCSLDCGDYTGNACSLTCGTGTRTRCGTSNVWVCPGTPCP